MKNISIEYDEDEGKIEVDSSLEIEIPFVSSVKNQIDDAAKTTEGLVMFGAFSTKSLIESAEEGKFFEDLVDLGSNLLNPQDGAIEF